jgi:hypothetical protein
MRFAFALLLLGCASPVPLRPLPPGKDLYYTLPAPAQSRFLHLAADGVFHLYVRSLPMTTEALRGTWRVDGETQAVLRCERWSHMTVVPPVRVRFGTDWAAQVPHVRTSIADFLREHPERGDFSREELEDVGNWETRVGGEAALVIPIGIDVPRVSRRELEAVLPALDAYRESGDPREVRVRLHRHRGTEFLEWLDWSGYVEPRPLAAIHEAIERRGRDEILKDVWVRLSPDEFRRELGGDGFHYNR